MFRLAYFRVIISACWRVALLGLPHIICLLLGTTSVAVAAGRYYVGHLLLPFAHLLLLTHRVFPDDTVTIRSSRTIKGNVRMRFPTSPGIIITLAAHWKAVE